MPKSKRMSIEEFEHLLNQEEDVAIEILPNGEVRQSKKRRGKIKPLTMRENLGGEYAL